MSKKYSELYRAYQEKSEENKVLKVRISNLEKENHKIENQKNENNLNNNLNSMNKPNDSSNNLTHSQSGVMIQNKNSVSKLSTIPIKESERTGREINDAACERNKGRMMAMINKNIVDDLDAIYFFDKINMRANSASHNNIPKLDLNFLQVKTKKREDHSSINVNTSLNIKKIPVTLFNNF